MRLKRQSRGARIRAAKRELRLLEGGALASFVFLICIFFVGSGIQERLIQSEHVASVLAAVLVDLANGDRAAAQVGSLRINPQLVAAAQAKANDMATKGYFAHVSPEGKDSWYWFKQVGYSFEYAGENLAVDFSDSGDVERAWLNSPLHRENILNAQFAEIGIATAEGLYEGHRATFVVQMFGTPTLGAAAAAVVKPVTRQSNAGDMAIATAQRSVHVLGETSQGATSKQGALADMVKQTPASVVEKSDRAIPTAGASAVKQYAPTWGFLATSPKTTLRYVYYVLAALVLMALLATTGLEFRRHHLRHMAVAGLLLGLMVVCVVAADTFLFSKPVVALTESLKG